MSDNERLDKLEKSVSTLVLDATQKLVASRLAWERECHDGLSENERSRAVIRERLDGSCCLMLDGSVLARWQWEAVLDSDGGRR